jgi:dTDP-D-glucose 4,6-dehydratase
MCRSDVPAAVPRSASVAGEPVEADIPGTQTLLEASLTAWPRAIELAAPRHFAAIATDAVATFGDGG